jgi:geranylgeranyl diphosphate synthase type I
VSTSESATILAARPLGGLNRAPSFPEQLERFRPEVSQSLRGALEGAGLPLYAMVRYHMGWQEADGSPANAEGKGVRPALALLSCAALSGRHEHALPAAVAIELAHNFSLVHDDVQDEDEERHHRATVWKLWGKAQAINAGDVMFALALESLQQLADAQAKRSTRVLLAAIRRMVEGQYMDLSFEPRDDVSVEEYVEMIGRKTGAMIAASCRLGAISAEADSATEGAFEEWGRDIGLTFQIVDDVLGIWGDAGKTGKSNVNDIARKKKSLPVVYGFAKAGGEEQARMRGIYAQEQLDADDVGAVAGILENAGAREYALDLAAEYHARATRVLDALELTEEGRTDLQAVADFVLNRSY